MNARLALLPLIDRLAGAPVACIGDVMLDRYVRGRAERISPEAPVPVLSVEDETAPSRGRGPRYGPPGSRNLDPGPSETSRLVAHAMRKVTFWRVATLVALLLGFVVGAGTCSGSGV